MAGVEGLSWPRVGVRTAELGGSEHVTVIWDATVAGGLTQDLHLSSVSYHAMAPLSFLATEMKRCLFSMKI